ncbi:hypothetical protein [Corynebacterium cystitidis]|uniref:hypothetical protein n=1 Tax=Corynebacterium cystitidis TaxID=35757 RepID=UPI00211F29AF|nr:hypothetical protein [Corynebacterium cystitidis]
MEKPSPHTNRSKLDAAEFKRRSLEDSFYDEFDPNFNQDADLGLEEDFDPDLDYDPDLDQDFDDLPSYLADFDDEELEAYATYLEHTERPDSPDSAQAFQDDFWGTYDSVEEFTRNWDWQAEPLDSVQSLLARNEDLLEHLTLSEIALVDRLSGDMDFLVEDGKITIFTKQPEDEPC